MSAHSRSGSGESPTQNIEVNTNTEPSAAEDSSSEVDNFVIDSNQTTITEGQKQDENDVIKSPDSPVELTNNDEFCKLEETDADSKASAGLEYLKN